MLSPLPSTHTRTHTRTHTLLSEVPILTRPYAVALGLGAWGQPSLAPGVRGLSGRVVARCLSVQQKRALSPGLPTLCWGLGTERAVVKHLQTLTAARGGVRAQARHQLWVPRSPVSQMKR